MDFQMGDNRDDMPEMKNLTIDEFARVLSSAEPVPGGGGASGLVAALGMGLGNMVLALTSGKKKYAAYQQEIEESIAVTYITDLKNGDPEATVTYEDLETDSTGRIPSIDNELVSGRYFLVEKTPPPGYTGLDGDIVFDISPLGGFTLVSFPEEADIKFVPKTEGDTYKYFLNIPNTKDEVKLTVSKTVAGAFGNKSKEFTFTFETEDGDPTRYSYTKKTSSGSLIMDQTIMHGGNFTLGHNEEIVITMPADTEVTITESDTESDGYVTTVAVDAQTAENARSKHLKVSDDTTLSFVNTRDGAIPTGVSIPIGMLVLAGLIAFGGIFATIMRQKKMKEQL